jgi:hypothetical protein
MYVGKRTKSILSILLICGLLLVSVPTRVYAAAPAVALTPAIKYAIAAGLVACGLYAVDNESITYVINDYWNEASDHVKKQWQSAVVYGTKIGNILLNDIVLNSINLYLDANYSSGTNIKTEHGEQEPAIEGERYYKDSFWVNGYNPTTNIEYGCSPGGTKNNKWTLELDGVLIWCIASQGPSTHTYKENWVKLWVEGDKLFCLVSFSTRFNPDYRFSMNEDLSYIAGLLGLSYVALTGAESFLYEFVGDSVGFGNATEDRPDIKVPCPPVPATEWPDQWIDDLLDELNLGGNPTLDDETSIEEWEDEYEWYVDQYTGEIYKVRKGEDPRNTGDEPKRIPGPPLPGPDIPDDYPTEDDPDITIEHHPPQTTVTEHPDGSRTEVTTQTSTITKTWWDPSDQVWRTTTEETTTTTTIDYDPEGNEIGRTTTTDTQPKGETEETPQKDDTAIDWEPLRRGLYELTEKFPFCLPWDLMRGIQSLESNQWDRQIRINVGDGIWPEMVIDLTMFDKIARITRVVLLVVFDLGLVFATRRLMGGDV